MNAVYALCHDKGVCLVAPSELLDLLPAHKNYDERTLEEILNELALDDYFQLLSSDRKGEKMYVISLRANGYAFKRSHQREKRDLTMRLVWAVVSAVVAFCVGVILKRIF